MRESKKVLRRNIKALFSNMEESDLLKKSEKLSSQIASFFDPSNLESLCIPKDFVFGAYAPMIDEADWSISLDSFKESAAFPGMKDGELCFYRCRFDELVVKYDFGTEILSPPDHALEVVPDLLLMPGRAFSHSGERLGRGRGFYDKYLKNYHGLKIGICLENQVVSDVPTEVHDVKVDYLITDKQTIKILGE